VAGVSIGATRLGGIVEDVMKGVSESLPVVADVADVVEER